MLCFHYRDQCVNIVWGNTLCELNAEQSDGTYTRWYT